MKALTALAAAFALVIVPIASARTLPVRQLNASERTAQIELHAIALHVAQARSATWRCQDNLGIPRTRASAGVWALPTSIPYRKWVQAKWDAQRASCARALDRRTIPATNDWVTATTIADRIFPGTKSWLLSCSSGEGSWGAFKMNYGGSGAGGWMQFMSSTYYAHNDAAFAAARAKGYLVPETANSWYSPLGQAITAAHMRSTGQSHHWDPGIDPRCA